VRIAALETEHRFGDPASALDQLDALLASVGADLALCCEAALTGYVSPEGTWDLTPQAEPLDGPTRHRYADLARRHRTALVAPLIEQDGSRCYNSFLVIDAGGQLVARYRKRHPWVPETWATPGQDPYPILDTMGPTLTMATCYDVHFVSHDGRAQLAVASALLFPSAWVDGETRRDTREYILPRLARRHGIWVVNANWAFSRPRVQGQGGSMIVDPDGTIVAHASPGPGPQALVVDIAAPRRPSAP
jgi:predicted amidohydrolase